MPTLLIRILLIYTLLLLTMRLMGKRQIGQMQVSELVTTFLLSELAAAPIADDRLPLAFAVVPIAALVSFEVIISYAVTRLPILKPIFDGKPNILIKRGELLPDELLRVRISIEELLSQLRVAGISDISDVDYAILEHNGQLSVIPKRSSAPPSASELNKKVPEPGLAHAVIVDSRISDYDLSLIGHDRDWLEKRLGLHKTPLSQVLLYTIDDAGSERIIKKCARS